MNGLVPPDDSKNEGLSDHELGVTCGSCGNRFFQTFDAPRLVADTCQHCWAAANPTRDRLDYYRIRNGTLKK